MLRTIVRDWPVVPELCTAIGRRAACAAQNAATGTIAAATSTGVSAVGLTLFKGFIVPDPRTCEEAGDTRDAVGIARRQASGVGRHHPRIVAVQPGAVS